MRIDKINDGMAHLLNEANPQSPLVQAWPKGKCLKMRCILEGIDYYIPDGQAGILGEPPYHPFAFEVGYSECRDAMKIISITKHCEKRFFQTGISTEVVNLPNWWEKRDQGML